jgi:hypothetical protein
MMAPPGDGQDTEQELIARVIPLRRRDCDQQGSREEVPPPEHSDAPGAPEGPSPPRAYSIWEQPAAGLLRREAPEPVGDGERRSLSTHPSSLGLRWWGAGMATVCVVAIAAALLISAVGTHGGVPERASRRTTPAGLGASLPEASANSGGERPGARAQRRAAGGPPRERGVRGRRGGRATRSPRALGVTSINVARAGARPSNPSETPSSAGSPAEHRNSQSAPAHMTREFGFER